MKKRRDFIKAVAASTGALTCNKVIGAPIGATIIPGTSYLLLGENQFVISASISALEIPVATPLSTSSYVYGSTTITVPRP